MTKTEFNKKNIYCLQFNFLSCFSISKNSNLVLGFIYSNYLNHIIIIAWAILAPNFYIYFTLNYILTHCKVRAKLFLQTVMSKKLFCHKYCHELFW